MTRDIPVVGDDVVVRMRSRCATAMRSRKRIRRQHPKLNIAEKAMPTTGATWPSFHWTIETLIIVQGTVGLIMTDLPRARVIPVYSFHKSLGLTILALAALRLTWRALIRPDEPAGRLHWHAPLRMSGMRCCMLLFVVPLAWMVVRFGSALRPLYWFGLSRCRT
jgi:cytochrome b561